LCEPVPFAEVLAVKANLAGKINDLLLSLPPRSRPRSLQPSDFKSIAAR
jgi:hypothetical protein